MAKEIKNVYDLLRIKQKSLDTSERAEFDIASKVQGPERLLQGNVMQAVEEAQFVALPKPDVRPKTSPAPPEDKNPAKGEVPFHARMETLKIELVPKPKTWLQKDYVKYPMIFVFSFALFYFILNFGAFYSKLSARFKPEQKPAVQTQGQVLGVSTPDFSAWVKSYFFQSNVADSLGPNTDYDRDGLTNYQEFLLNTNPTKEDTDNDTFGDGREILNGYNPLYEGKLTAAQQEIISKWDMRDINNRVSYLAVSHLAAGPAKPSNLPAINYDLAKQGEIYIPRLNVRAPLIWSKDENSFQTDLENGVIHYPGTSFPGQAGLAYISGHSSNYIWSHSKYSYVFTRLNELQNGDEFFISINGTDGNRLNLRYLVYDKKEFKPEDQSQFEASSGNDSIVNLSTCWPLGSTARRYVVSGKLMGI